MDPSRETFDGSTRDSYKPPNGAEMMGQSELNTQNRIPYNTSANNRNWQIPLYWQQRGNEFQASPPPPLGYVTPEYGATGTPVNANNASRVDYATTAANVPEEYANDYSSELAYIHNVNDMPHVDGLSNHSPATQPDLFETPAQSDPILFSSYPHAAQARVDPSISKDLYNMVPRPDANTVSPHAARSASSLPVPKEASETPFRDASTDLFDEHAHAAPMHSSISISTLLSDSDRYEPHVSLTENISPVMAPSIDARLSQTILRGLPPAQKLSPNSSQSQITHNRRKHKLPLNATTNNSVVLTPDTSPLLDSDEVVSDDDSNEQQTMMMKFNYLQHLRNKRDEAVHAEKRRLLDIRGSIHDRLVCRYENRYNKLHASEYNHHHDWAVRQAIREEVAAVEAAKIRADEEKKKKEREEQVRLLQESADKDAEMNEASTATSENEDLKDDLSLADLSSKKTANSQATENNNTPSKAKVKAESKVRSKAKSDKSRAKLSSDTNKDSEKNDNNDASLQSAGVASDGESSPETPLTKASKSKKAKASKLANDTSKNANGETKSTPKKSKKKTSKAQQEANSTTAEGKEKLSGDSTETGNSTNKEASTEDTKANATASAPNKKKKTVETLQQQVIKEIARKEIPRVYKIIQQNQYNRSTNARKTSQLCGREARRWQFRTIKNNKDMQTKAKRAMRETMVFWKRNERVERDLRKKAEREALDRAKKEEELRESRRQARKLDFLITQTELYSHFVGRKMDREQDLPSATNTASVSEINFDSDEEEDIRRLAVESAQEAVQKAREHSQLFDANRQQSPNNSSSDMNEGEMNFQNPTLVNAFEVKQPKMLMCKLKEYQLKGLNWLANLYEQGINGILADEMGLGKTVQSISVMAYLAETHNIWGPFLVIAPASTLHNWQQEITRFVPKLKCIPYWGSTKDRKILRKFWCRKNMTYDENSPFHVVVTSYQLVVLDAQYFQSVKWQYMILDEAQAIKSSSSSRWKSLLAFKCRNRLLLTGTPIQNTMQELWALLHFIMPSLFDSHNEFSEWFSKDIESHAQSNTQLNEQQLKRLHMILKPFMLRRVKKNVQSELGEKIEKEVYCDLTQRQKILYQALRRQISIAELLEKAILGGDDTVASIMNLVMQFRKVCNHPDLFEREDVRSPLSLATWSKSIYINREGNFLDVPYNTRNFITFSIPRLLYEQGGILSVPGLNTSRGFETKYLYNLMNIWNPEYTNDSIKSNPEGSPFSWLRFVDESPQTLFQTFQNPVVHYLDEAEASSSLKEEQLCRQEFCYGKDYSNVRKMLLLPKSITKVDVLGSDFKEDSPFYHLTHVLEESDSQLDLTLLDSVLVQRASAPPIDIYCPGSRQFTVLQSRFQRDHLWSHYLYQPLKGEEDLIINNQAVSKLPIPRKPLLPSFGIAKGSYSNVRIPSMLRFIADSGKLSKLDKLLVELKANDHRVLIYFQMTRMIDLMEEYLTFRQYKYLRLDGSSKISQRRDMVTEWQTRPELFVFLLSTRAGGLGINLTAADTVIFYDSDWNPSIDSQAMDRAHRIGQQKQVTVYRFITRGTIEERIVIRAKEKEEVQKVVISGGETRPTKQMDLKGNSREMVSWLLEE
ncbi:Chromatin-remodeling ATPase INO80 [Schizosaccharomyces pombe]|uniref:Chromatin-remodeling ATPase INO80 n=1 Tax=Schizosaccharomyces pombe (strain 972 / ATCC 24843) TaxID=284812 RepID=INO80_SCHPO|nr:SNF2 family helicase Ino80 [Schizosaccharomyces pombe]O14148.4 RecName: Full=Chromatin-remodeling ATPase INO80 [Schizosaccharomyces pombe 972h-]CAB16246.2 SNF2 family helicase Ino80 [Schizosaccharomyces pombe]|eukprot:NP_001018299.1 SNF2 family helicase Ino80 [Schizosaccharomyces pombe]